MKIGCAILVILVLAGAGFGGWYYWKSTKPATVWVTDEITMGSIRQTISATGSLAALTTVAVGCQVSGIIASIAVDFNDQVKEGQLIAVLDPSTLEAQVQQATANMENARANERNVAAQIENLKASLLTAKADLKAGDANVEKARVALGDAERNLKRMEGLSAKKLISTSDLETAQSGVNTAKAALEASKAQLEALGVKPLSIGAQIRASEAQHDGTLAQVRQTEASLNVSKINLERTKIYSPIDGVVVSRDVDVGQTVAANFSAPTLFTIAKDLKQMRISTSVDEADIGKVRDGQEVSFTVDAFKGKTFRGRVSQVRLSPQVTSNVVTYPVMVDVENDQLLLKPGMTANVEILVDFKQDVLRLPTRALFYKPSQEILGGFRRNGGSAEEASGTTRVWGFNREKQRPIPLDVVVGIGNNQHTEIVSGALKPGQEVLVPGDKPTSSGRRGGPPMRL